MVKAIIPDLTLIKVIIVFLICNAKSAKPDQYINTINLGRCNSQNPLAGPFKWCRSVQRKLAVVSLKFTNRSWADHRSDTWWSTYRAGPPSYNVKTQRSILTEKDSSHVFSLGFLQRERETWTKRWPEVLWNNNNHYLQVSYSVLQEKEQKGNKWPSNCQPH